MSVSGDNDSSVRSDDDFEDDLRQLSKALSKSHSKHEPSRQNETRKPGSAVGTPRTATFLPPATQRFRGWSKVPLDSSGKPISQLDRSLALPDQQTYDQLNEAMVGQINQMYAYMNQAIKVERARHSSETTLILRKVEKDLKDTFRNVRDTFKTLTDQMMLLVHEVESSRKHVKCVKEKQQKARQAVEAQAQYVQELEAVLDSQESGASKKLHELANEVQKLKQALNNKEETSRSKERALKEEILALQRKLKRYEASEELSESCTLPFMAEMSASWTQHSWTEDSHGSSLLRTTDLVSSVLKHCDASRQVSRLKVVRMKTPRSQERPAQLLPLRAPIKTPTPPDASSRVRARCSRLHRLVSKAARPLELLSDVFAELRNCVSTGVSTVGIDGVAVMPSVSGHQAQECLGRITSFFFAAAPQLQGLSHLVQNCLIEAARSPPAVDLDLASMEAAIADDMLAAYAAGKKDAAETGLQGAQVAARPTGSAPKLPQKVVSDGGPVDVFPQFESAWPTSGVQESWPTSPVCSQVKSSSRLASFSECDEEDEDDG